ncbi:hypothetical protein [Salinisphaera sp. T31B1]|uniref:hypothetical protein n=1 Tax=Salinisphaera sp. T31B1 TaxID=727963 RepID=UPI003341B480
MAANWLRKPENQQKIKRTARRFWDRFQQQRRGRDAQTDRPSDVAPRADAPRDPKRR